MREINIGEYTLNRGAGIDVRGGEIHPYFLGGKMNLIRDYDYEVKELPNASA